MEHPKKKISPIAINALTDSLTHIYWYKNDLRTFVCNIITDSSILVRLDWESCYKREIVNKLVRFLTLDEDRYQSDLLHLITEVCNMNDFSHLEKLDDGIAKASAAKASVEALRNQAKGYQSLMKEEELKIKRRADAQNSRIEAQSFQNDIDNLKKEFLALAIESNAQKRGFQLESFIKKLFVLFDLDPKASFRITGEQIDGAFTFDNIDYLLEIKWQKELIGIQDLDAFNGKLSRKLDNTLGLFLSIDGFSEGAINAFSTGGRRLMFLMDGADLMGVLDGRIDLLELLRKKRRHASQTGNIYLGINKILSN